jgi:hypothetical protein
VAVLPQQAAREQDLGRRIVAGPRPQRRFGVADVARIAFRAGEVEVALRESGRDDAVFRRSRERGAQLSQLRHGRVAATRGQPLEHRRIVFGDVRSAPDCRGCAQQQCCSKKTHGSLHNAYKTTGYHTTKTCYPQ